ncbi:MAG: dihydropteroate synthase [Muribaculaceae bacterium]|nr:dihydropteroate synthase [Muribaculaceae bacterium]
MREVKPYSLNIKGRLVEINRPQVMGILNVTPDSFFIDSRSFDADAISHRVATMVAEGADMIDIGAYSSRPGAGEVSATEEMQRLERGMAIVRKIAPSILVSVDTFRADVARYAVESLGVDMVNDISAGLLDDNMVATVAQLKVPYIAMHMRGTPATMSEMTQYDNVVADVMCELSQRINEFTLAGINDIIIDPGFGFAKTTEQNYELLQNLELFHELGYPLLVGVSRKSMICRALGVTPDDALNGTTVVNTIALQAGASILRVHDVKQAVEAVKIMMLTNKQ